MDVKEEKVTFKLFLNKLVLSESVSGAKMKLANADSDSPLSHPCGLLIMVSSSVSLFGCSCSYY